MQLGYYTVIYMGCKKEKKDYNYGDVYIKTMDIMNDIRASFPKRWTLPSSLSEESSGDV